MYNHLRPYQQNIVHTVESYLKHNVNKILVQSPTGSGKSVILAYLLQRYLQEDKNILLIAHKIELIEQLYDHIKKWLDFQPTIMANTIRSPYNSHHRVCIASIQTWYSRYSRNKTLPKADLIVVDEAHHCASNSYIELFKYYNKAIILGFTATPRRTDGLGLKILGKGKGKIPGFSALVHGIGVDELIKQGYLCDFKLYSAKTLADAEGKIRLMAGDYHAKELADFVKNCISADDVVSNWRKYAKGKKTVIYPVSVELSKVYCQKFNDNGIPAAHICANTSPLKRQSILDDFREGKILVLCQHSIVIEGVDVPDIECVQFIRPTRSLVVWLQAIGRGLRPAPNKEHLIIIDHTTTHKQLPLPNHPIYWDLQGKEAPQQGNSLICPFCKITFTPTMSERKHNFIPIQTSFSTTYVDTFGHEITENVKEGLLQQPCHVCGKVHKYPFCLIQRKTTKEQSASMSNFKPNLITTEVQPVTAVSPTINKIQEIFSLAKEKGYKKTWAGYKALELPNLTHDDLDFLAKLLGYENGWVFYEEQELGLFNDNKPKMPRFEPVA